MGRDPAWLQSGAPETPLYSWVHEPPARHVGSVCYGRPCQGHNGPYNGQHSSWDHLGTQTPSRRRVLNVTTEIVLNTKSTSITSKG